MRTNHKIIFSDSRKLTEINDESINLVVTSPPYPMIQMWDDLFSTMSRETKDALNVNDGNTAFEAMHSELDKIWSELYRVLKFGSFACINIGDATRSVGDRFQLYPNHARIINSFRKIGFDSLPVILWRKQTNAPNKFMGSGMLPSGAYVTLEHEYILVFRKGPKREFKNEIEKYERMKSSFFWEERNRWFSDIWDFKGTSQGLNHSELRSRSAAYPLELAYRLINMYSLYGDVVLDPFMGTGTTGLASIACGRNSIGVEIDKAFSSHIIGQEKSFLSSANSLLSTRINSHNEFVTTYTESKGVLKYRNVHHGFPVFTRQETGIQLFKITEISEINDYEVNVTYEPVGRLDNFENMEKEKVAIQNLSSQQLTLSF
ncbi:MAG: site-specific DNA-methyltransferase [Desulfobacteraceae bacterium]|nr:MAG: site-specific DNA-methyltransferase [Desulfobacteraceae bacterium]